jgi:hypothetical protein
VPAGTVYDSSNEGGGRLVDDSGFERTAIPKIIGLTYNPAPQGSEIVDRVLEEAEMSPLRYRRTSVRTALGITAEEKRIKRDLGITAILKPFRWWGNEKRKIKREVGYYSPEAKFARHEFPHSLGKLFLLVLMVLAVPFLLGWFFNSMSSQSSSEQPPASAARAGERLR